MCQPAGPVICRDYLAPRTVNVVRTNERGGPANGVVSATDGHRVRVRLEKRIGVVLERLALGRGPIDGVGGERPGLPGRRQAGYKDARTKHASPLLQQVAAEVILICDKEARLVK